MLQYARRLAEYMIDVQGWKEMLKQREELLQYVQQRLAGLSSPQLRLLQTPNNSISMAVSLHAAENVALACDSVPSTSWTMLGSMLFNRSVSGARVIGQGQQQTVAGMQFQGYGAHCDNYPCSYITVAAALGTTKKDIDAFLVKLNACLADLDKQRQQK